MPRRDCIKGRIDGQKNFLRALAGIAQTRMGTGLRGMRVSRIRAIGVQPRHTGA
jgi:hypothetical protein